MDLMPGEQTIWQGHPTWRSMLAFHLQGFAMTFVAVLALWLLDWLGVDISTVFMSAVAIAGVAITILSGWIQRFFTEYSITDRRLHIRRGILSKTETSTNVDRIQNITLSQSVFDRILKCGKLEFDTASGSDNAGDKFDFIGVNDPQELRERIMRARDFDQRAGSDGGQGGLG